MKFWTLPDHMKLATIWVVWVFLAIGGLGWALFVVLAHFGATSDAAVWVQAIGSVLAVVAAIFIASNQHTRDLARRRISEAERDMGLSMRLNSFALEFKHYLNDVLSLEYGHDSDAADREFTVVLERMMFRLDSNFDEDLDLERQELVNAFRRNIAGLIYLLKAPIKTPEAVLIRSHRIKSYRNAANGSLIRCANRLRKAVVNFNDARGIKSPTE